MLFQAEIWKSLSLPAFCLLGGYLSIFKYDKKTLTFPIFLPQIKNAKTQELCYN